MKTVIVLKPSGPRTLLNRYWNIFLTACEETAKKNTPCWETPTPFQLHSCPSVFLFILKRDELCTHLSFISSEGRSNSLDIPSLVRAENTCPLSIQASSSDFSIPFHIIHSRMSVSNCRSSFSLPYKRSEIFKALLSVENLQNISSSSQPLYFHVSTSETLQPKGQLKSSGKHKYKRLSCLYVVKQAAFSHP